MGNEDENLCQQVPIALTELSNGKSAMVVDLQAQRNALLKFETLGIIPGVRIKKISSAILHGPIIVEKDFTKVALGYKMATKVLVKQIEE
ncbi:ferrous iron transport protein A [bacterium]|nr:ferrous iron transport protein A [bacterium]